jgi:hypothetical protein
MGFLRQLESPGGMLQGLSGMFVTRQVIFFPMVHSSSTVSMGREFVELGSSLVRIVWHTRSYLILTRRLTADILRNCPIVNTRDANRFFYNPEETQAHSGCELQDYFVSNRPLVRLFGGARERGSKYRFPVVCR